MELRRFLTTALIAAAARRSAHGQDAPDQRPRLLLESAIGSAASLGFKFPSTSFGASVEMPFKSRFEFQSSALYSPDRKLITDDGTALNLNGSAIAFATSRFGITGRLEHTSLWTSQFDKSGWAAIRWRGDPKRPSKSREAFRFLRISNGLRLGYREQAMHGSIETTSRSRDPARHTKWFAQTMGLRFWHLPFLRPIEPKRTSCWSRLRSGGLSDGHAEH
jgi:hypothetical protein